MKFSFAHNNFNVLDLEKSIAFYEQALGFKELRRHEAGDGSFTLAFMGDGTTEHMLELTWLKDRTEPYDLGENEFHLAVIVDDYESAHQLHQQMNCICYENPSMGLYFINDPDKYWIEIIPAKH